MNKIKMWRENAMMTQEEMAKAFEMPKRTLENWEQGSREPAKWAEKLVIEKLKKMTQEKIEHLTMESAQELMTDKNGKAPVMSWAVIEGEDTLKVTLYETMELAVENYKGSGYVGLVLCNDTEKGPKAWYTDSEGNEYTDHWGIDV